MGRCEDFIKRSFVRMPRMDKGKKCPYEIRKDHVTLKTEKIAFTTFTLFQRPDSTHRHRRLSERLKMTLMSLAGWVAAEVRTYCSCTSYGAIKGLSHSLPLECSRSGMQKKINNFE